MALPLRRDTPVERDKLPANARRAVVAAMFGTLIEWYDYALFGIASAFVIGPLFFPKQDATAQQLLAYATFAVGFFVRPLGGFVISFLGDRIGRKPAMLLTIILMGAATVGIGLLPTARDIGLWAPIMLLILRFVQGFGAGAELAGALTLVSEYTPQSRRGFFIGLIAVGASSGVFVATLAFALTTLIPGAVVTEWVWRIPFLVSAILFFVALWIRHRLEETPAYARAVEDGAVEAGRRRMPVLRVLRESPRELTAGFMCVTAHHVVTYVIGTFALGYLTKTVHMPLGSALTAVLVASFVAAAVPPVGGALVDRVGTRKVAAFGGLAATVLAWPLFAALQSGSMWFAMLGLCAMSVFVLGATSAGASTFVTNLFPTRYRFTGVATARELNGALVAGPTPYLAAWFIEQAHGGIWSVSLFVAVAGLISFASVFIAGRAGLAAPASDAAAQRAVEANMRRSAAAQV